MKRLSLKQVLVMAFVGLMTMAGTSLGDLPPGEGPMTGSENETGQGDQERDRTGECKDLLGVESCCGGAANQYRLQKQIQQQKGRDVLGVESCCEGDANQYRQQQQKQQQIGR